MTKALRRYDHWLGRLPVSAWDTDLLQSVERELAAEERAAPQSSDIIAEMDRIGRRQALDHLAAEEWRRRPYPAT
jgi:hypothetical protein